MTRHAALQGRYAQPHGFGPFSAFRQLILFWVCLVLLGPAASLAEPAKAPDKQTFAILDGDPTADRISQAARAGARFIILSKPVTGSGAPEPVPGAASNRLGELAKSLKIWISALQMEAAPEHVASTGSNDGGSDPAPYYRTSLLFDDTGRIVRRYRQVILDPMRYRPGALRGDFRATVESVDANGYRLGIMNGRDVLVGVARMADRGANAVLIHSDWALDGPADWTRKAQELARRFDLHLVIANAPSRDQSADAGAPQFLESLIVDRSGAVHTAEAGQPLLLLPLDKRPIPVAAEIPLGLPASVPAPDYRPATEDMIDLGRTLFFDKTLSKDDAVSCASCHRPDLGFANGERLGVGFGGLQTKRNVPTVLNVAFRPLLRWDGYASSIENFIKYPISGHNEMNVHYLDALIERMNGDAGYVRRFKAVFGEDEIEFPRIEQALAAYMRSLLSGNSRFDRYWFANEETALTAKEKRGLNLFLGRGRCAVCHVIQRDHALFTDYGYHNLGVGWEADRGVYKDLGLGGISTNDFSGLFQTPILRDVALTAPYMHDGSLRTLKDVVDFYNNGGIANPDLDPLIKPLRLSDRDLEALVAFLKTLTGDGHWSDDGRPLEPTGAQRADGLAPQDKPESGRL